MNFNERIMGFRFLCTLKEGQRRDGNRGWARGTRREPTVQTEQD
jgi:hypothetical protein